MQRLFCSKEFFLNICVLCFVFLVSSVLTKLSEYHISSNKRRASNKRRTFGYTYWNKYLPLISTSPLISAAPVHTTLIRIVTIFY